MRVLFIGLISFSLAACAIDDEDMLESDDDPTADEVNTVERDVAAPTGHDATFERTFTGRNPDATISTSHDHLEKPSTTSNQPNRGNVGGLPAITGEPENVDPGIKPVSPDSRREVARLGRPAGF